MHHNRIKEKVSKNENLIQRAIEIRLRYRTEQKKSSLTRKQKCLQIRHPKMEEEGGKHDDILTRST